MGLDSTELIKQDPNGIDQHDSGAKLDAGKPMAGRLLGMFGGALMAVAEVGTFGAKKYTEGGWQHVEDGFKRYDDAGMRHFLKRGMGEELDPESELPHLAHEAWNALAKLELYLREKKEK
ncbi:putative phosphodiestherase [Vibrio phage 511E55-1]|nr:putative phosphodiestherase [Vibrio phage 511E55-1]